MEFKKFNPSNKYAHLVAYYWTLKSTEADAKVEQFRFVPDAYIDWVFHHGEPWQCDFPNLERQTKTGMFHVFGQIKKHIDLTLPKDSLNVFGVKFHPWVANKIWKLDMHYLTDSCLDLTDLDLPNMKELQEKISLSSSINGKIKCVEAYLRPYLSIDENKGLMHQNFSFKNNRFELKSSEVGLRRIQQRFKREIGIAPKLFFRTLRINAVIEQMLMLPNQSLTQHALDFNYFDQTHFIKDFKHFTGMNPSTFLKSINPDGDILNLRVPN